MSRPLLSRLLKLFDFYRSGALRGTEAVGIGGCDLGFCLCFTCDLSVACENIVQLELRLDLSGFGGLCDSVARRGFDSDRDRLIGFDAVIRVEGLDVVEQILVIAERVIKYLVVGFIIADGFACRADCQGIDVVKIRAVHKIGVIHIAVSDLEHGLSFSDLYVLGDGLTVVHYNNDTDNVADIQIISSTEGQIFVGVKVVPVSVVIIIVNDVFVGFVASVVFIVNVVLVKELGIVVIFLVILVLGNKILAFTVKSLILILNVSFGNVAEESVRFKLKNNLLGSAAENVNP